RLEPSWRLVAQPGYGGGFVHRGNRSIKPQFVGQRRKTSIFQGGFKRSVFAKDGSGAFRTDPRRARNFVRWVTAQRDEIGHLFRFDTVSRRYRRWPDAKHFAAASRLKDRRPGRGELKRIAIAGGDDGGAAALFLSRNGSGEKVIGLESGGLRP